MPAQKRKPAETRPAKPEDSTDEKAAALEAAVAEATADPKPTIDIEFRGQTYTIEREILSSGRFLLALAGGQGHEMMFEILGPNNSARFIASLERGEHVVPIAAEFFKAVNSAAGSGNS